MARVDRGRSQRTPLQVTKEKMKKFFLVEKKVDDLRIVVKKNLELERRVLSLEEDRIKLILGQLALDAEAAALYATGGQWSEEGSFRRMANDNSKKSWIPSKFYLHHLHKAFMNLHYAGEPLRFNKTQIILSKEESDRYIAFLRSITKSALRWDLVSEILSEAIANSEDARITVAHGRPDDTTFQSILNQVIPQQEHGRWIAIRNAAGKLPVQDVPLLLNDEGF